MFNFGFIGLALSMLPELLSVVGETIQAVETQFGAGNGEDKKKAVVEAVTAAYRLLDKGINLPETVDLAAAEGIPHLVEFLFKGMKDSQQEATDAPN